MATTTLTTFLLQLPTSIRTVDLLGSWDNFQEAYPLQKDRQAGPGHWRGCHTFKNIICDGQHLNPSASRNGGLKMGGTYWYFYRLDGDFEQHDSGEPSTTACPLLPGQHVNILEVPIQQQDEDHRPYTLAESAVFTLDPKAKYSPLKPPLRRDVLEQSSPSVRITEVSPSTGEGQSQRPCSTTYSTASRADLQPLRRMRPNTSQGSCITLPKGSAVMAMFHKMRGARSASSGTKPRETQRSSSRPGWETEPCSIPVRRPTPAGPKTSRVRTPVNTPMNTPEWPLAPPQTVRFASWAADSSINQSSPRHTPSRFSSCNDSRTATRSALPAGSFYAAEGDRGLPAPQSNRTSSAWSSNDRHDYQPNPIPQSTSTTAAATTTNIDEEPAAQTTLQVPNIEEDCLNAVRRAASPLVLPIQSNAPPSPSKQPAPTGLRRTTRPPSLLHDNRETLQTFYAISSSSCGGGQLSPHYLSRPETPSVRDFEVVSGSSASQTRTGSQDLSIQPSIRLIDTERASTGQGSSHPPPPQQPPPCPRFQGYTLPEQEYKSTLTLRKPASAGFAPDDAIAGERLGENDQLVREWDDGSCSAGQLTGLEGLVQELGFLGRAIV
ncbi:MAG: hypothetical protein Q9177_002999 [Variospora cf. flavescens]